MNTSNEFYSIFSFNFYRCYFIHMRPYLLFVSAIGGLSGMAIAENINPSGFSFWAAFFCFFLAYGFGQALTDCFQMDTDAISSPYRPLVLKQISPKTTMAVSFIGLILIATTLLILNTSNLILLILSVFGLATYTYFKKNFWWAGPFYNGGIVMLLPFLGIISFDKSISFSNFSTLLQNPPLVTLALMTLFSYANFVLMGYLKDISADKATNYHTFPVVFGWDKTVWVGDLFAFLSSVFALRLIILNGHTSSNLWAIIFFIVATIIALAGQLHAHFTSNKSEHNSSFAIAATVRSYLLWHISAIASVRPSWEWALTLFIFYIFFEVVLLIRPSKVQI